MKPLWADVCAWLGSFDQPHTVNYFEVLVRSV